MAQHHLTPPVKEGLSWSTLSLLITLIICFCLFETASSQTTCSVLSVSGGAAPGVYTDLDTPNDGRPSYGATFDGEDYTIMFVEDTTRRRRRRRKLENDRAAGMREIAVADDVINSAHRVTIDAMRRAKRAGRRSLAECMNGFWLILASGDETAYPWFMAPDCARHPADISEGWFEFPCEDCDPTEVSVTVDCEGTSDSSGSTRLGNLFLGGGAGGRASSSLNGVFLSLLILSLQVVVIQYGLFC